MMKKRVEKSARKKNVRKGYKRQQMMDMRKDPHLESFTALKKPKFRIIGPGVSLPTFRFPKKTEMWGQSLVRGRDMHVKTGLTVDSILGAGAAYGIALAFSIGDIPDAVALASVFDEFILYKVMVRFTVRQSGLTVPSKLFVVADFDDSNVPPSEAAVRAVQNVQEIRGFPGAGATAGPNVRNMLMGDSLAITLPQLTSAAPAFIGGNFILPATWQDVGVLTNDHYGIKAWYTTSTSDDASWDVDAMYYYGFRNTQ